MPSHGAARDTEGHPAPPTLARHDDPSAHVALLAATALGFAYAPTADDTQARRLVTLADHHLDTLARAETAVLELEIGTTRARERAAALLCRAGSSVTRSERCGGADAVRRAG